MKKNNGLPLTASALVFLVALVCGCGDPQSIGDDAGPNDGDVDSRLDAAADSDASGEDASGEDADLGPPAHVERFDFQDDGGPLEMGYTRVVPADLHSEESGYGFVESPRGAVDGTEHTWTLWSSTINVDDVIPDVVLSDATRDCVITSSSMHFRVDVPPGDYTVTLWLGDVTTPRHQVRADVNGEVIDVERMDINHQRGSFDQAFVGNAVPRTVTVAAPDGVIDVIVGAHPDGRGPIEWTYEQDEDPKNPPETKTAVLVPAFTGAGLQALTLHTAATPALELRGDELQVVSAPVSPELDEAVQLFNTGDISGAAQAFDGLEGAGLRTAAATGLFAAAGHPALIDIEPDLLARAEELLIDAVNDTAAGHEAAALLLQVRLAASSEAIRQLYGYESSGLGASFNMGRSCSLVEHFQPDHFYHRKGQILWLRNRGGLDPRRVTVSWERAQWLAQQLDPLWGDVNPYVHLYATDEWVDDGNPWTTIHWTELAGDGPDWAISLMSNLNAWIDLMEWWAIHRQAPEGDIGGGWTDDVEIVPAFGLVAYVLEDASDILRESVVAFADGLWDSSVMDQNNGYQRQYADVEHTAEPTGNILHLYPLVRFGDPEGIERMLVSARTFDELFLTDGTESPLGHRHFVGNHLSSTEIARNDNHRADIPLCGRVTAPFPFLVWYSGNPGAEGPLQDWAEAWAEDAARTDNGKPSGIFPNMIWTPTDGIGDTTGNWWARNQPAGQFGDFPGYQHYLYSLAGFFYLRTGDPMFRAPFDAVSDAALLWDSMGRPDVPDDPPAGREQMWCGERLSSSAQRATVNLALATGLDDWDEYLEAFAGSYGQFLIDPSADEPFDSLSVTADLLNDTWPYRTTEGVMTDRILVPGWADVISYYMGAEVFTVFFGMPVHAASWINSSRLFAAAVTEATTQELEATVYLFSDDPRRVGVRLWQLELGADYELEAGPADDVGLAPSSVDQRVPFHMEHLGDSVFFDLPARTVYAIRITQTSEPPGGGAPLLADLAVAPRDVTFDEERGEITLRVHNVGAATATGARVTVYDGLIAGGPITIGSADISGLDAPVDLIPRDLDIAFEHTPSDLPAPITVVVDTLDVVDEITEENNVATAWIGGASPEAAPPMITGIEPSHATPGDTVSVVGRNIMPDVEVLSSEAETSLLDVSYEAAESAILTLSPDMAPGQYLVSLRNPDGKRSNLVPMTVTP